ncbi:MAG: sensor domain-containing diguanylate cyclase [Candidatus Omnitrophota bacterium]
MLKVKKNKPGFLTFTTALGILIGLSRLKNKETDLCLFGGTVMGFLNDLSIEKQSIRQKLLIAFSLMSIIPLLSMAYFVANYIFPEMEREMVQISVMVILSLWISWMGYLLARNVVLPVIDMANEMKKIASGKSQAGLSLSAISRKDELGDIANSINVMVAKIRKNEKETNSREVIDRITGLYTFSYLKECMAEEIKRAQYYQRPCSLVVINIDNCKKYEDDNGEDAVETLFKKVADILVQKVPPVGKVARNDFDEFGLLLPEKNKRESLEIAENIRKKIEEIKFPGGNITASIGVGENPIDGEGVTEVLLKTLKYLDRAKKTGKNKVLGE